MKDCWNLRIPPKHIVNMDVALDSAQLIERLREERRAMVNDTHSLTKVAIYHRRASVDPFGSDPNS
eukprot:4397145-Amphidinium_carterae.1